MTARVCAAAALSMALVLCACTRPVAYIDVATTTSVQNSGLLDTLIPQFMSGSPYKVRVHAAGSGRALEMMADGIVDLVIAHAPQAERRYLDQHPATVYRKLAFNWFVVAGPRADPAKVREATDVADAFRRIAKSATPFVSRGDNSGTHERELELWSLAGLKPPGDRLIISGRGMALALRHADEISGYTLSDEATFLQLGSGLDLEILYRGDPRLLNTYAVVFPTGNEQARALADWLTGDRGRALISNHRSGGLQVFSLWPESCPGDAPEAKLCA